MTIFKMHKLVEVIAYIVYEYGHNNDRDTNWLIGKYIVMMGVSTPYVLKSPDALLESLKEVEFIKDNLGAFTKESVGKMRYHIMTMMGEEGVAID